MSVPISPKSVISLWNKSRNKKDFENKLRSKGFACIGAGRYSAVYGSNRANFVVKVGLGVTTRKLPKEIDKFRLPYIFTNGNRQVALQVRVSTNRQYEALKEIKQATDRVNIADYDIHKANVGWYQGKPVIIDYLPKSRDGYSS